MRYRLRDIPAILRNPLGPSLISGGLQTLAWPLLRPVAAVYRRTVARNTRLVAVTGSFGKTTTCRAIAAGLDAPTPAARNHKSGIAVRLLQTAGPGPFCVLEVGIDGPGQMRGFARMVRPEIAVLTGIGSEHGRSLLSLDRTLDEKARLLEALPPDGLAILNADDPRAASAAARTRARVCLCGFHSEAHVRVEDLGFDWPFGQTLRVSVHGRSVDVRTRLLGRHFVFPALATLAAAHAEGVDLDLAAARLAALPPTSGRMQLAPLPNGAVCINDAFKGSLESFIAAVDTVAELPGARKLLILGDITEPPGSQAETYRRLGRSLAQIPGALILHIGRERQLLRAGAKNAGVPVENIRHLGEDVLSAIEQIRALLQPGDTILIKGRDTQKLERILLALQDAAVRCGIRFCDKRSPDNTGCAACPLLERGWDGLPQFMGARSRALMEKRKQRSAAS